MVSVSFEGLPIGDGTHAKPRLYRLFVVLGLLNTVIALDESGFRVLSVVYFVGVVVAVYTVPAAVATYVHNTKLGV